MDSENDEQLETTAVTADGSRDVMDYIEPASQHFALQELARYQHFSYFLPLFHELFNGGEVKTRILFALLQGLMSDERVQWSRGELDEKFHWLRSGHRGYLIQRLSTVGWLEYYRDQGVYMISDKGEALMRILSRFSLGPDLVENEGTAVAEIEFSQLLELPDITERLWYLRNRLRKHIIRADTALQSDSAYLILEIYQQLKSAYRWAEQTRLTLDHLEADDDDSRQWLVIRSVHDNLSQLHSLISKMQLVLQDIQYKQIDISRLGLTHLDFDNFLINAPIDLLSEMMSTNLYKIPHPFFVVEENMFSEASGILSRDIEDMVDARGWETELHELEHGEHNQLAATTNLLAKVLNSASEEWHSIEGVMEELDWETAAYRLSMLTLLADRDQALHLKSDTAFDPVVSLPVEAKFDSKGKMVKVKGATEDYYVTRGSLRRNPELDLEALKAARDAGLEAPKAYAAETSQHEDSDEIQHEDSDEIQDEDCDEIQDEDCDETQEDDGITEHA